MKYLLFLIFTLTGCARVYIKTEYQQDWPQSRSRGSDYYNNHVPVAKGFIVMENQDTLKGYTKLSVGCEKSCFSLVNAEIMISFLAETKRIKSDVIIIHTREINLIRYFPDSTDLNYFIDFVHLNSNGINRVYKKYNNEGLWMLEGRKKNVSLYNNHYLLNQESWFQDKRLLSNGKETIK